MFRVGGGRGGMSFLIEEGEGVFPFCGRSLLRAGDEVGLLEREGVPFLLRGRFPWGRIEAEASCLRGLIARGH